MGIIDRVGSIGEKAHSKLSASMVVKDNEEFNGNWNLFPENCCFIQKTKKRTGPFHESILVTKRIYVTNIYSIDLQSSSRDSGSITKAALGGAVIAGPVGAIAGGLFAASRNVLFVKIKFKDSNAINAYLSQEAYDYLISVIDVKSAESFDTSMEVTEVGGGLIKERVFLVGFLLILGAFSIAK